MWHKPNLLNWTANLIYAVAGVLALYIVLYFVVHLPIFALKEVKVDGHLSHVTREQVRLIVQKHLKGNFFTLDLARTRDAFEKLPWARNVSIRRRWPDQLVVSIEEHAAMARWGDIALVNSHGELFHAAFDGRLPVFYGPGDGVVEVTKGYADFSKILNKSGLQIDQLTLSPRRSWEIKTNKNMLIALGRVDMQKRLHKFAKCYDSTISKLNVDIRYADLRYPNGFAIRKPT
jgi:cell division protein FtsQ